MDNNQHHHSKENESVKNNQLSSSNTESLLPEEKESIQDAISQLRDAKKKIEKATFCLPFPSVVLDTMISDLEDEIKEISNWLSS